MPHNLSIFCFQFSPPPARHRHSGSAGTSDLSIWLFVAPMADKYPGVSPYTYCGNNPVRLVDEDGREVSDHIDKHGNIIAHYEDGDNSVYLHKDGVTKSDIDAQRSSQNNMGGYGTKIGALGGNINVSEVMKNKLEQSVKEASTTKPLSLSLTQQKN